jgi:membrane protein implicated in regulation of membrane protease activity
VIDLNYWVFVTEVWLILGIALIIADIFLGFNFFVLPVGIAALIIAGLIFGESRELFGSTILFENWKVVVLWFAGLSLVSVGLLKIFFQRSKKDEADINQY